MILASRLGEAYVQRVTLPVLWSTFHGVSRDLLELVGLASRLMAYINAISEIEMKNAESRKHTIRSWAALVESSYSIFLVHYPAYVI